MTGQNLPMRAADLTAEQVFTVDSIPVLTVRGQVPQFRGVDRRSRRLNRYYRQFLRSWLHYCTHTLYPPAAAAFRQALSESAPLPDCQATLTYTVTLEEGAVWSLYLDAVETDAAHNRLRLRRSDTWDLRSGYPLPISAFFPGRSGWRKQLLRHTREELLRRQEQGESLWHPDWRLNTRRHFNPMSFYLTAQGLCWFYPMYCLGPAAEGLPLLCLPWQEQGPRLPPHP